MRTANDFYEEITTMLSSEIMACNKTSKMIKRLEEQETSGMYASSYVESEIKPSKKRLKRRLLEQRDEAIDKIKMCCDEYTAELYDADCLDVKELTDDVRLLSSGIRLTDRDLRAMLSRAENNPTMQQILLRYAEDHGLDTGEVRFRGNTDTIKTVSSIPACAKIALKWNENPSVYDRLFGAESDLARTFGGDE